MRVLERYNGEWKIAFLLFLNRVHEESGASVIRLDQRGRILWSNKKIEDMVIGRFGLEVEGGFVRAIDPDGTERLRAALKWAAGIDVLDGRRTSFPVVLENDEGDRSHICWVVAESGLMRGRKGVTWVQPGLWAEVRHLKGAGMLRHASTDLS